MKNPVHVFVSWSGDRSHEVAKALHKLLKAVLAARARPWVCDLVEAGKNEIDEIRGELSKARFGIFCITRENQINPWLHFEAGAIAKDPKYARVVPYLVDDFDGDIWTPFRDNSFKPVSANRSGTLTLLRDLATLCLGNSFDRRWAKRFPQEWEKLKQCIREQRQRTAQDVTPYLVPLIHAHTWAIENQKPLPFHVWLRNQILHRTYKALEHVRGAAKAKVAGPGWNDFHDKAEELVTKATLMLALCGRKTKSPSNRREYFKLFFARAAAITGSRKAGYIPKQGRIALCRIFVADKHGRLGGQAVEAFAAHQKEADRNPGVLPLSVKRSAFGEAYESLARYIEHGFGFVIFRLGRGQIVALTHEGLAHGHAYAEISDPLTLREILRLFRQLVRNSNEYRVAATRTRLKTLFNDIDKMGVC